MADPLTPDKIYDALSAAIHRAVLRTETVTLDAPVARAIITALRDAPPQSAEPPLVHCPGCDGTHAGHWEWVSDTVGSE